MLNQGCSQTSIQEEEKWTGQAPKARALVEVPKTPRGVICWSGYPHHRQGGIWEGLDPSPEFFLLFVLKMKHFGAVFQLDLTEETRTQLQQEEAIAKMTNITEKSSRLVVTVIYVNVEIFLCNRKTHCPTELPMVRTVAYGTSSFPNENSMY